jgi:NAD(P)-dependent dehydrogenase (short-subunit alcohol dehydrogenase family)
VGIEQLDKQHQRGQIVKKLIITGASRGIGLAVARNFLNQDYQVVNLSRSPCPLESVRQIHVDLSDPVSIASIGDELSDEAQNCQQLLLVHNAGLLQKDSLTTVSGAALRRSLEVNLVAPVALNQLLLPLMPPSSSIIYVGSTLSEKAVANSLSYVVAKHGLIGLMRSTCQDLAGTGIHTACVCPGFTDTEMLRTHIGNDQNVISAIAAGVTFGRLITPEEIADTIGFCATSPVLNGAVIHANLGQIER